MRALSATIGLLALPPLYLLGQHLFTSKLAPKLALALFSVSPIFVRYSQESRQYSLWIVLILLSSLYFLKAIKTNRWSHWIAYSTFTLASLYTHLFALFVFRSQHSIFFVRQPPQANPSPQTLHSLRHSHHPPALPPGYTYC